MEIQHDTRDGRFVASLDDGDEAVVEYRRVDSDTLDYTRTFVPETHRGEGIATELVEHALDYAMDNDLKVIPSCPFVASVMEDDPRYSALMPESS